MPLVNTIEMLQAAREGGYCVGAFNMVDFLSLEAIMEAAERQKAPAIIQTSSGTIKAFGLKKLVEMARTAAEGKSVPLALHLDHGTKPEMLKEAILSGYNSVMIDASEHAFEKNVEITRDIVAFAHTHGVSVEGEVGVVAGVEDDIVVNHDAAIYTTPEEALSFQKQAGVDFLAPAIGTAHGVYKVEPKLNIQTLQDIHAKTACPLVVHGGTGLSDDVIRMLVSAGAAKFNVSTQIKNTYIDATFGYIESKRMEYNILKVLAHVKEELTRMIARYMDVLGCAGKA